MESLFSCQNGQTPLMVASEQGNIEIVKELIRRGTNVNLDDVVSIHTCTHTHMLTQTHCLSLSCTHMHTHAHTHTQTHTTTHQTKDNPKMKPNLRLCFSIESQTLYFPNHNHKVQDYSGQVAQHLKSCLLSSFSCTKHNTAG